MRRLVSFGCSFTQGVGLSKKTTFLTKTPDMYAWPNVTAGLLGWEVDNKGSGGISIKQVAHDVLTYQFQPGDVVCIMWPNVNRTMFLPRTEKPKLAEVPATEKRKDQNVIIPSSIDNHPPSRLYYHLFYSEDEAKFSAIVHMHFVLGYLNRIGIPVFNLLVEPKPLAENRHDEDGCFTWMEKYQEQGLNVHWTDSLLLESEIHKTVELGVDNAHYHKKYHTNLANRLAQKLPELLDSYTN